MKPRLLLLTPPAGPLEPYLRMVGSLAELGPAPEVALLLRRPGDTDREILAAAACLRDASDAPLLIHRRPDLAILAGARGVHLPESGLPIGSVRRLLGSDALIGASRHDAAGLQRTAGADYATLSPLFTVPDKGPALGPERFAILRAEAPASLAVLALGGIDAGRAPAAMDAGADGVAVLRAATDPAQVRALLDTVRARKG